MDDRFTFGEPAKRPAKLGAGRPQRPPGSFDVRLVLIAAGRVGAAVLAFVVLRGADEAGTKVADARSAQVDQIDRAYDVAAQANIGRAVTVAHTLFAERGTFETEPEALSALDPSITFTSSASTGPTSVAYTATGSAFGAAVLSRSGTCFWVKVAEAGTTSYGSGGTCTGQAALGASASAW